MKGALLTAAALLGAAEAGVHKMKLQKIPLSEQLVSIVLDDCVPRGDATTNTDTGHCRNPFPSTSR